MADENYDVRFEEDLRVHIVEAKDIPVGSNNNPRDTYCKVAFDQETVFQTETVDKSCNPIYDAEFNCEIPRKFHSLKFSVCEKNKLDKILGDISIKKEDLHDYNGKNQWFKLQPPRKEIRGKVHLEIEFEESIGFKGSPKMRRKGISVRLIECEDLTLSNGQCNPHAHITLWRGEGHKNERKFSNLKKKTANPTFNEGFFFELDKSNTNLSHSCSGESNLNIAIKVSLWHDDSRVRISLNKPTPSVFLGEVLIPIIDLDRNSSHKAWYLLQNSNAVSQSQLCRQSLGDMHETLGSLRVKIIYNGDHVFTTQHYDELRDLILKSPKVEPISASAAYLLSEVADVNEDVAAPLVNLFLEHGQLIPFIRELAKFEMKFTHESTTLFRGNSLVSKIVDEMMKLVGKAYLQETLRPIITEVTAYHRPCEIDPKRLSAGENLDINMNNLVNYVQKTFEAIVCSGAKCPTTMCETFFALREATREYFPNMMPVRHQVVSGFIFLRFFVLAIANPRLFQLTSEISDHMTTRTLTLISKTIQTLGNLVSANNPSGAYGHKEEYMVPLYAKFSDDSHREPIKQFLDMISTFTRSSHACIEAPVTLKEGFLTLREERKGQFNLFRSKTRFRLRYFVLTNYDLTYSKKKATTPASTTATTTQTTIPINNILAVEELQQQDKENMFQIIQQEKPLYVQADNCVVAKEWKHILHKVCMFNRNRLDYYHPATFSKGQWLCCRNSDKQGPGCWPVSGVSSDIKIDTDSDRNIERIYSYFHTNLEKIQNLLVLCDQRPAQSNGTAGRSEIHRYHLPTSSPGTSSIRIDNPTVCLNTLKNIRQCIQDLVSHHDGYLRNMQANAVLGSQEFPYGGGIRLPRVPSSQALAHRV